MVRKNKKAQVDDRFIMSPKVDFAFKLLFGDPKNMDLLKALLSSILNLKDDEFEDLTIINNELMREFKEDKKGILDVRAKMKDGKEVDIEIQVLSTEYMAERTLYYWSKMYTNQIKSGDTYDKLKKCITINILDFECIPLDKIHTSYHIIEDETGYKFTDVLEIHYLELPKLERKNILKNENDEVIQWMEFIGAKSEEVMEMLAEKNNNIRMAYDRLKVISKDDKARMAYEAREAEIHDQMTRLKSAREEGIKEGKKEGEKEGKLDVARNLLQIGMDVLTVIKVTGLDEEEIKKVKERMH